MRPIVQAASGLAGLLGGIIVFSLHGATASDYGDVWKRGQKITEKKCARCHAIGTHDASPFEDAPPFRDIANRYEVEGLAEGITVGRTDMPEFIFPPEEISELFTFMDSFSE